jgi:hypothetical protein
VPHQGSDFFARLCFPDRVESRLDRLRVELLGRRFVQERSIDCRDLRLVGVGLQLLVRRPPIEERAGAGLGEISQQDERSVARLVGRDLRARGPLAVDVAKEVVAGLDGAIHAVEIDSPLPVPLGGGGRRRGRGIARACTRSEQAERDHERREL